MTDPAATETASPAAPAPAAAPASRGAGIRWLLLLALLMTALAIAALSFAWNTQQRVKALEIELVKRQQDSANTASEARVLSRQAESMARDAAARVAVLDARVAETSMQRTQIEELMQSLARTRDENLLADLDNGLRVAMQQTAITGSAEPLILSLRQAEDRLVRHNQPRLEPVKRAVAQDLDRISAAGVSDVGTLAQRVDAVIRTIDELPMLGRADQREARAAPAVPPVSPRSRAAERAAAPASAAAPAAAASLPEAGTGAGGWLDWLGQRARYVAAHVWSEAGSLLRVTRIDLPEAVLLSPEQANLLRESLKLRLLNARLGILSRQFDTARQDLLDSRSVLERYFDSSDRRVQQAREILQQVEAEARTVTVPRPEATLAAIATSSLGR